MQRLCLIVGLALAGAGAAHAQLSEVRQTIFGMD